MAFDDVSFDDLWTNHPSRNGDSSPCRTNGESNHENQCVIRLGVALAKSGVSLESYTGDFCWSHHGKAHPLRVEEMKLWLNEVLGEAEVSRTRGSKQKTNKDYEGRTGIVACIDFYGDNNQGDHIDLWDGKDLAGGYHDYFERSKEIWYWRVD